MGSNDICAGGGLLRRWKKWGDMDFECDERCLTIKIYGIS